MSTSEVTRPGIYKRWGKIDDQLVIATEIISRQHDAEEILGKYSVTGQLFDQSSGVLLSKPSMETFEFVNCLVRISNIRVAEGLIESAKNGEQSSKFSVALAYRLLYVLLEIKEHMNFEKKFPGRKLRQISLADSCLVACGYGIGAREESGKLAELLLTALRNDYCFATENWPIFHFILRLYCEWQGIEYPLAKFPSHPIMNGLLAEWRTTDMDRARCLLIAACDHHTQRARADNGQEFFEFNAGWRFYPVEILMVMRLRQYLGLANPKIDHPIMEFAWSRLGAETRATPDPLLQATLERAKQDEGFDPDLLYSVIVPSKHSK